MAWRTLTFLDGHQLRKVLESWSLLFGKDGENCGGYLR